jgi:hypothetical protein
LRDVPRRSASRGQRAGAGRPGFRGGQQHYKVGAIFSEIAQQMPAGNPGSLSQTQYTQAMAYILQKNGYPAGANSLAYNAALGSSVPLVSQSK